MSNNLQAVSTALPTRVRSVLENTRPEVIKELFDWLDGMIRGTVSKDPADKVMLQIQTAFPKEIAARARVENPISNAADVTRARKNPDTLFAYGLTQNPNYKIEADDVIFARENPDTLFAEGLTQNPNYKIEAADVIFARINPGTLFAYGLTRNPNCPAI